MQEYELPADLPSPPPPRWPTKQPAAKKHVAVAGITGPSSSSHMNAAAKVASFAKSAITNIGRISEGMDDEVSESSGSFPHPQAQAAAAAAPQEGEEAGPSPETSVLVTRASSEDDLALARSFSDMPPVGVARGVVAAAPA